MLQADTVTTDSGIVHSWDDTRWFDKGRIAALLHCNDDRARYTDLPGRIVNNCKPMLSALVLSCSLKPCGLPSSSNGNNQTHDESQHPGNQNQQQLRCPPVHTD